MHVTVDEAALRLGVSVATVRRRLSKGQLIGQKVGRDWQVLESALPAVGSSNSADRPASFTDAELSASIEYIARVDSSEVWVPDILRWADALSDRPDLMRRIRRRMVTDLPGTAIEVRVPKNSLASRAGTMLDLADRVIYQAAVGRVAQAVDDATSPRVYSARLSSNPRYFLMHSVRRFVGWRRAYMAHFKGAGGLLVQSDLSSYFDTIDQPTLLRELEELAGEAPTVQLIRRQLKHWTVLLHRGIPQGPNASRLLGNAYLLPIDQHMLDRGYDYWRYMDDVAIVVADHAEAARAVADFERVCHARGLLVSSAKTTVQTYHEASRMLDANSKDSIEYLLRAGSPRAIRALRRIFTDALPGEGVIEIGDVKFSLWRLALRLDRAPLTRLLDRIQDLGPVASVSAAYLRHFLTVPKTQKVISDFLHDPERNTSDYLESWLFAAMLEFPAQLPDRWTSRARSVAHDRNCPTYQRILALNCLALSGKASDVAEIKRVATRDHDPEMSRGALVGLHRISKLDRITAATAVTRHPELQVTLDYLGNRRSLPSLVYRGRTVTVRA